MIPTHLSELRGWELFHYCFMTFMLIAGLWSRDAIGSWAEPIRRWTPAFFQYLEWLAVLAVLSVAANKLASPFLNQITAIAFMLFCARLILGGREELNHWRWMDGSRYKKIFGYTLCILIVIGMLAAFERALAVIVDLDLGPAWNVTPLPEGTPTDMRFFNEFPTATYG